MNESFSFHRIGLLTKNIFLQNWKKDLCIFLCLMGGLAIWKWLIAIVFTWGYPVAHYMPINIAVAATLLCLASLTFRRLSNQSSGIMYLTLPASTLEKVVVTILQVQIYYLVLLVLSGLAGYALSICLLALTVPAVHVSEFIKLVDWRGFGYLVLLLTTGTSAMLFASVYFKKLAMLWSTLIGIAVLFVAIAIDIVIARFSDGMTMRFLELSSTARDTMYIIVMSLVTLFFWFMTWLRLRETEV